MSKPVKSYKDLIVWQKSIQLVTEIYKLTETLPKHEIYGLSSQMRRCAISIPSNIAEGRRRGSRKDFARFISIAYGSGAELETQIIIARNLFKIEFSNLLDVESLLDEIMRILNKMQIALYSTPAP